MNQFTGFTLGHDEYPTPQGLFDKLNEEFGFTLDVAADPDNAKCAKFFTRQVDGLLQPWEGVVFCNPPYSGKNIEKFLDKATREQARGITSVFLLPARTGNGWFHKLCLPQEVRFIRGRIKFGGLGTNAPFDSMIVVFRGKVDASK